MFVAQGRQFKSRAEFESLRLRSEPCTLGAAMPKTAAELQQERPTLVTRLRTRLGLGDDPKRRMALYLRLQMLHDLQPELVERAIAEVWAAAVTSAKNKERFFCVGILRRLVELGVVVDREGKQHEPI